MERKNSIFYSLRGRSNGLRLQTDTHRAVLASEYLVKRLKCEHLFVGHQGCVNTVAWNESGDMLLSGSDDCKLNIYRLNSQEPVQSIPSGHRANIFSAKFLPCTGGTKIVSCSGDGVLHYNDVNSPSLFGKSPFRCHSGTTYEVNTTPAEPHSFLSSGEDGTVRFFDLRLKTKCLCEGCKDDVLIDCGNKAVTSFSVNPLYPYYIAVGCEDSTLRVYDRRSLSTDSKKNSILHQFKPKSIGQRKCRVTSLNYSSDGQNLLASFSTDYVYLFDSTPKSPTQPQSGGTPNEETDGLCPHVGNDTPMKRLRLRGDWSDTGPNARPESEDSDNPDNTFIHRMSGYLTRWMQESMENAGLPDNNTSDARSRADEPNSGRSGIHADGNPDLFSIVEEVAVPPGESSQEGGDSIGNDVAQEGGNNYVFEDHEGTTGDHSGPSEGQRGTLEYQRGGLENQEFSMQGHRGSLKDKEGAFVDQRGTSEDQRGGFEDQGGSTGDYRESLEDQGGTLDDQLRISGSSTDEEGSSEDEWGSSEDHDCSSEDQDCSSEDQGGSEEAAAKNPPIEYEACSRDAGCENGRENVSRVNEENNNASGERLDTTVATKADDNTPAALHRREKSLSSKHRLWKYKTTDKRSGNQTDTIRDKRDGGVINRDNDGGERRIHGDKEGNNETMADDSRVETIKQRINNIALLSENQAPRPGSDVTEIDIRSRQTQCSGNRDREQKELETSSRSSETTRTRADEALVSGSVGEPSEHPESDTRRNAAANIIQNFFRFRHKSLVRSEYDVPVFSEAKQIYKGHRNARTMIKEANFWGDDFVLSGSDCGRIFIWSRHTGELVTLLEGDRHVVNCVQPHPFDPILATSGIDYDIKLWTPTTLSISSMEDAHEVIARNEKMLRESRDTLTVPASFMIRVLSSLHRVRVHTAGNDQSPVASDNDDDDDDD